MKHLWLDLEDTIITPVTNGWFNTHLMNVGKITKFIDKFKPDKIHIFSFALWDKPQILRFNEGTRPMVENALNCKFSIIPSVDDDIIPACCSIMGLSPTSLEFTDLNNFWGKHEAFRLFMRHQFDGVFSTTGEKNDVVLLDDVVINEQFIWPDLGLTGQIFNIDTM